MNKSVVILKNLNYLLLRKTFKSTKWKKKHFGSGKGYAKHEVK